ncbi:MAG: SDR family NAD(P)-dependent oxidoreductase, partial [Actinomycetota bacterium]|nr:SDR family NAD(P)-dependent oxidoreductase [Actinomycetota bacterium]
MNIENLFSVNGKVALVTGGSRGIGYMIAEGLIRNGVRVYITSRKTRDCDSAAQKLREFGECVSIPADVASTEGILSLASELRKEESKLDILVNNAGAAWGAPLGEFPDAGFEKVMDINVKAPFMLTQEFLPELQSAATSDDP